MNFKSHNKNIPYLSRTLSRIGMASLSIAIAAALGVLFSHLVRDGRSLGFFSDARAQSPHIPAFPRDVSVVDCMIDRTRIFSGGPPKDGIPSLTRPRVVRAVRAKYPSASGEVIGVKINGEARAYPVGILNWHEAINDTLGGVPIVVTHCPLCRSSLVFRRDVGGQVREFGISGLLYQSNVLLYDRQTSIKKESLWSQVAMKAVCGPAARAGLTLQVVDSTLTTFADWKANHPDSTVISRRTGYKRPYREQAYSQYFSTEELMFPVSGRTDRRPDLGNKDMVLVLNLADRLKAYPYADLQADVDRVIDDRVAGAPIRIYFDPKSGRADVETLDAEKKGRTPISKTYMFWFIYDASYPGGEVYDSTAETDDAQ